MNQVRPMRRRFGFASSASDAAAIALRAVGLFALVAGGVAAPARAADADVSIVDFAFEPATLTVAGGDTVTWTVTRAQDPHTVSPVDPPGAFEASSLLRLDDSFAVTFAQPGTYRYECTIHPEDMRGVVVVEAAGSTESPTAGLTPTATPAAGKTPSTTPPSPGSTTTPSPAGSPSRDGAFSPALVLLLVLVGAAAAVAGAWLLARTRRGGP